MNIDEIIKLSINDYNKSKRKFNMTDDDQVEIIGPKSKLDSLATVELLSCIEQIYFKYKKEKIDLVNKIFSSENEVLTLKNLKEILKNDF
tara:strand:- start:405 stop:674 length:270 start_codon:yes stop_codon:yes gene_type:complete